MKMAPSLQPAWARFVAGPNAVLPGKRATAVVNLSAGEYAVVCLMPDRHGIAHGALGMVRHLTVGRAIPALQAQPQIDATIVQSDFAFSLSKRITAGRRTIEVLNAGTQRHEVVLVRLAAGVTAKDFAAALESAAAAPPLGEPIGGVVGLERGRHAYFTSDFKPAQYGLICFFTDRHTGAAHHMKGMTLELGVE